MGAGRVLTVLVAVALVVAGLVYGLTRGGGGDDAPPATTQATPEEPVPSGATVVDLVISPEKERLLAPLVAQMNAERAVEVDGTPVHTRLTVLASGDAATRIARGDLQPTLWSPASSLWGRLLDFRADADLAPDDSPSLVRTPLVIAMTEPLARALGWPETPIGWGEILAEARSDRGWAAYGHPEWGDFKFGQTNPEFSTSGLSATVAEYLVAAGKREGLTLEDIATPKVRAFVRDIQSSVVHYGDTTLFFAEQMAERGPTYVSAVAMEEATLLDYNLRLRTGGPPLVAIYPREGTFFSDNPVIGLTGPWVDEAERRAGEAVSAELIRRVTPAVAAQGYFRPAGDAAPAAPIDAANGADPAEPTRLLGLPEPRVLNAIVEAWREDRKPARVEIVIDVSGSMAEEGKLEAAKKGVDTFLRLLQPQDEVGLSVFSDRAVAVSDPVPMRTGRAGLRDTVSGLFPEGDTALYDATRQAVDRIARTASDENIDAVVVLSDGADNASETGLDQLLRKLEETGGSEGEGVRVFTIAYGTGAEQEILARMAEAGGGRAYVGDPETIEKVYVQISSFF